MRSRHTPTLDGALTAVRTDEDARFAAVLAAVLAFSLGFALGVAIGEQQATEQ